MSSLEEKRSILGELRGAFGRDFNDGDVLFVRLAAQFMREATIAGKMATAADAVAFAKTQLAGYERC